MAFTHTRIVLLPRQLKEKTQSLLEAVSESTAACLITMVQGNLLAITLGHWIVASQTGFFAGMATSIVIILWRQNRPWIIAAVLGLATAGVDYFVHPGKFGPVYLEALVTGAGAAALSYLAGIAFRRLRARRQSRREQKPTTH